MEDLEDNFADGFTPFEEACRAGDLPRVKELVAADGEVLVREPSGFIWAAYNGATPVVRYLLACGAEPDYLDPASGGNAFHAVCCMGHMGLLFLLLECGADPTLPTAIGTPPLVLAAKNGHASLVHILLGLPGVSADDTDAAGNTAMWWAVNSRHPAVVKLLLTEGADWQRSRTGGMSPMELASTKQHTACLRLFMGAEVTRRQEATRAYLLAKARQVHGDDEVMALPLSVSCSSIISTSSSNGSEQKLPARRRRPPCAAPPDEMTYEDDDDGMPTAPASVVKYVPRHLTDRVREGRPLPKLRLKHYIKWKAILARLVARNNKDNTHINNRRSKKVEPWKEEKRRGRVVEYVLTGMKDDIFWDLCGYMTADVSIA